MEADRRFRRVPGRRGDSPPASLSPGLPVLLLALPLLFLHTDYQPAVDIAAADTSLTVTLADVAVLAIALAALRAGLVAGFGPLRAGRLVWIAAGAFLAAVFAATVVPVALGRDYPFAEHFVTALKYAEYAVLAPAAALLVRTARDTRALFATLAVWSACATLWGLAQFFGLVTAFGLEPFLIRVPSFVGFEDFALLSAAALAVALAGAARGEVGTVEWLAGSSGAMGLVLSGALAGVLGLALAALAVAAIAHRRRELTLRRGGALAVIVVAVAVGTALLRGGDLRDFFGFLGLEREDAAPTGQVQTYSHRILLGYIGLQIFLDHPLTGVGWQGSTDEAGYGPQLAEARARFPDEPPLAFPSPAHPWSPHNGYIQALADMGLAGLLLVVGLLVAAAAVGVRAALARAPETALAGTVATVWVLLVAGMTNGSGLIAGIPLDALLWLSAGLAAAAAAKAAREAA